MRSLRIKKGIYVLRHELPNELGLNMLGNYEILQNCLNFVK